jgi:NADH dehydrogenase
MQEGRYAADRIRRAVRGKPAPRPFRYRDKGSFAVIGKGQAVGELYGRLRLGGFPAWLAWVGVHIFYLIGFRARLFVLLSWAYSYFTNRRAGRIITTPPRPGAERPPAPVLRARPP